MSLINIKNMSFGYPDGEKLIFNNLSLQIDTNYKLGLIARNGRGKSTFFKLLMNELEYQGEITASVKFSYFPLNINNRENMIKEILEIEFPEVETWEVIRELTLLSLPKSILDQKYSTLSFGEQTKVMLAILYSRDNNFMLLDEITNHVDESTKELIIKYLKSKNEGFILVSHDRDFLDQVIDHIMSINKTDITIQKGSFSTWYYNKNLQDNYERNQDLQLKSEIKRLKVAVKSKSEWSNKAEKEKYGDGHVDRGFLGAKAARLMKTSKLIESRMNKVIDSKNQLLHNIEDAPTLKIQYEPYYKPSLITINDLSFSYESKSIFQRFNLEIDRDDKLAILGNNGSGKSTLIKLILGELSPEKGSISVPTNLIISYVGQELPLLNMPVNKYSIEENLDRTLFTTILRQLDFSRNSLDRVISNLSPGEQKKIQLAKSLSITSNLIIWDEPLNYLDIFSRIQLEEILTKNNVTLIIIEHDKTFLQKIATKTVSL